MKATDNYMTATSTIGTLPAIESCNRLRHSAPDRPVYAGDDHVAEPRTSAFKDDTPTSIGDIQAQRPSASLRHPL
jgi:hypothetical protein